MSRRSCVAFLCVAAGLFAAPGASAQDVSLGVGVDVAGLPARNGSPPIGESDEVLVSPGLGVVGQYMFDAPDRGGFVSFTTIVGWRDAMFSRAGVPPLVVRANSMLGYRLANTWPIDLSMGVTFMLAARAGGTFPDGTYDVRLNEPLVLPTLGLGTAWVFDQFEVSATLRMEMVYPAAWVAVRWRLGE